ncbi:MAG TPA: oxidoreductase, partial [Burkholderiales bacterium]
MSKLFSTFRLRDTIFRNRAFVSPMCQYASEDGLPNEWHFVHLGSRAVGGAGLVMVEATAVSPAGRISPGDTGIWNDAQMERFQRISNFIEEQGAVSAIQIAHAGRKASTDAPWHGGQPLPLELGGWVPLAPSAIPFSQKSQTPVAMTHEDIEAAVGRFREAALRSLNAGFQVVEVHMAHGYLLHEFLSPLSNRREDEYGGSLAGRMRFPLEVARAVREVWPAHRP